MLVATGLLACPGAAWATTPSTVSNDGTGNVFKGGADPADVDIDMTRVPPGFEYEVTDAGNPLVWKGGCSGPFGLSVGCPNGSWTIKLGPLNDRLHIFTAYATATINTGAGDDVVSNNALLGTLHAGPGEDVVRAAGKILEIYGDNDDDKLYGTEGAVKLYGGGGQDVLLTEPIFAISGGADGGDGYDIVFAGNEGTSLSGGADDDILGFVGPAGRSTPFRAAAATT